MAKYFHNSRQTALPITFTGFKSGNGGHWSHGQENPLEEAAPVRPVKAIQALTFLSCPHKVHFYVRSDF
jgi:hypothetical protein